MKKKLELSQREVILHWMTSQRAKRYGLYTDGQDLYSHDVVIGSTSRDGSKYLIENTGKFTWSQLRHLDIMKEEFALLGNADNVDLYLHNRMLELQRINVNLKLKDTHDNHQRTEETSTFAS